MNLLLFFTVFEALLKNFCINSQSNIRDVPGRPGRPFPNAAGRVHASLQVAPLVRPSVPPVLFQQYATDEDVGLGLDSLINQIM